MMKRNEDKQLKLVCIDLEEMIPQNHLLKQINKHISFDFVYDKVAHLYSDKGRKSIDPVVLVKILIIGYLYGIKSERRLEKEMNLNIAYRWFCGLDISDTVPDHSTFSQNRIRRFNGTSVFRDIFNEIVIACIKKGIVTGDTVVSDGSFIPANVSAKSKVVLKEVVEKSTVDYLDELDKELSEMKGYRVPEPVIIEKELYKSNTDTDCGYIAQPNKKGLGYLTEMSVDTANGIVTGVDVFPANIGESQIILKHIKKQMRDTGLVIKNLALDAGYDVGAVHRGLEFLGITGYTSCRNYHNNPMKKGFVYIPEKDYFICRCGKKLTFASISYKKTSQNYCRIYSLARSKCSSCPHLKKCTCDKGRVRLNVSAYYPAFNANLRRTQTVQYQRMKRLRSIWAEGAFAVLKREHNLKKAHKRGINQVSEECLFAAIALNLKRMVKTLNMHFDSLNPSLKYLLYYNYSNVYNSFG